MKNRLFGLMMVVLCSLVCLAERRVEPVDLLKAAIPRDLIPGSYRNERPPHVSNSGRNVSIRFNGPEGGHLMFDLDYFHDLNQPISVLYQMNVGNLKPEDILARNLGYGEASIHYRRREPDLAPADIRSQTIRVYWEKYRLTVYLQNYYRLRSQDFGHEQAGRMLRKIAKATFEGMRLTPDLAELVVEQKHFSYDKAKVRISARADYQDIGSYTRGEITFTVRMGNNSWDFDARDSQVRQVGNELRLLYSRDVPSDREYTVAVTLRDTRYKSGASGALDIAYEDRLRAEMTVNRPVAEIMDYKGLVKVERVEPTTATGGLRVKSGGRVVPGNKINIIKDIENMKVVLFPDPFKNITTRYADQAISGFLYEGDKITLATGEDMETYTTVLNGETFEVVLKEVSSVTLKWASGLKGKAIWDPHKINYNLSGEFIVGKTRGFSGKFKKSWSELFRSTVQIALQQAYDFAQGKGVDWVLEKAGVVWPVKPLVVTVFDMSAGGSLYDDLIYVNVKSKLYIRSGRQKLDIFTLQGNPEVVRQKTRRRVTLTSGQMLSVTSAGLSEPRVFTEQDLRRPERETGADTPPIKKEQADIPSLNAHVARLVFFEGPNKTPGYKERRFRRDFSASSSRYIYWHLELTYPERTTRTEFDIETVWYQQDGSVKARYTNRYRMEPGWRESYYQSGWGKDQPGSWLPGAYRVELRIDGKVIASGEFAVSSGEQTQVREWVTHEGPEGLVVETPPDFTAIKSGNWPLALAVFNEDGTHNRILLITWHDKPVDMSEQAFQQQVIDRHRKKFPHLRDLETWQSWQGLTGHWFAYRYNYEGEELKALIYQDPSGPLPWEVRYVAQADSFILDEAYAIIRTLKRKQVK